LWRNPQVIAAIIAAIAAIVVAFLHARKETPPALPPPSVTQSTTGKNSPAVAGTGGDVTIKITPEGEEPSK